MPTAVFITSLNAHAQFANIEGRFSSKATSLQLIALDSEDGIIAASTTVVSGACSGSVAGIGKMNGDVLRFSPYKKEVGGETCVITVTFDKRRSNARIRGEGCALYSGAACGWEGDSLARTK